VLTPFGDNDIGLAQMKHVGKFAVASCDPIVCDNFSTLCVWSMPGHQAGLSSFRSGLFDSVLWAFVTWASISVVTIVLLGIIVGRRVRAVTAGVGSAMVDQAQLSRFEFDIGFNACCFKGSKCFLETTLPNEFIPTRETTISR
jgi:hypothetical protein